MMNSKAFADQSCLRYVDSQKIPDREAWQGYEQVPDVQYAHDLMFGKSIDEVSSYFRNRRSVERSDELVYMPRLAFQYYVFAFVKYLLSTQSIGDSDAASTFLCLLLNREKNDPGSVCQIYSELKNVVALVAENQARYAADPSIYGNFSELATSIKALCSAE